jgi:virginiamycin A acetyltransferase
MNLHQSEHKCSIETLQKSFMSDLRPIYVLSLFRAEIITNYMKLFDTIVISFSYLCTHQSNHEQEIIPESMKIIDRPNPNEAFPNPNIPSLCYIKNVVKNPNIIVGDYTYYDDVDGAAEFEKHVTHFYDFIGDRLIIGKFCAIAKGIEFVMNGANHRMDCATTYPFYIMGGDWGSAIAPVKEELPLKGDTVVGNDVWIGQNVTVMPGVHIGDGAIIGANSVVAKDIPPYAIAVGNPCRVVRKRFDDELIGLLLKFKWWDKSIEEIESLMPLLACSDMAKVKEELKTRCK